MKSTKLFVAIVIAAGLLLTACSGLGLVAAAPAALSNSSNQAGGTSAPAASAPVTANPQAAGDVAALQSAYEAVFQSVNPSVVTIEISSPVSGFNGSGGSGGRGNNGQSGQSQVVPTAEGSGFVWDTAGHIVTNNHVVDGASKITVTFSDGSSYDAKVVGKDPNTDLAVVQVSGAPASLLKPMTVGDSTQVKVGEIVVAIGDPFGLSNTMTTGIVSAIGRSISAGAGNSQNAQNNAPSFSIPDVIQTDAPINPGNSGGVLVDMSGALIGVPSQIESQSGSNSGVGFAIPSNLVSKVVPQLIGKGAAQHSYLGISGITVTPDVVSALNLKAGQQGILVASVVSGGPAEKAGLKAATVDASGTPTAAGDIITGIGGKPVAHFEDLVSYLYDSTQPGQSVTLTVLRNGQEMQVQVTLGTQPTK
ncbi:MAG TPA: trypsin-like peptidase domain-containing protein [Anaerolineales bacterium]